MERESKPRLRRRLRARKAVSRSCPFERADSMTRQPSAENALEIANPMPRLEPVTKTTLPRILFTTEARSAS